MMNSRSVCVAAVAMATASLVAAIAPSSASADERLRVQWWGSTPRAERTFAAIDLYLEQKPGLEINGETAGWGDYWTKIATQVAGRNAPDVMQMDYRYLAEYANRGALADLSAFRDGALTLEGFEQTTLNGGMIGDGLYGISMGANSTAMLLDAAAFEAAGVEVPTQAVTFAALADMAQKVAAGSDYGYGMQDGSGAEQMLESWLRQQGKALYTAEGNLGYDEADIVRWFEMWSDLRDRGVIVPPDVQALDQGTIDSSMLTLGHAPVAYANSNQLVSFRDLNSESIVMLPLPLIEEGATGGQYRKPSMLWAVSAQAEDPAAAAEFINFFLTDGAAAQILDLERGVPESAVARAAITDTLSDAGKAQVEYIANLGAIAGPLPPPPPAGAGEIEAVLKSISQEVAFGQTSIEDAASKLVAEAQAVLDRNK